MTPSTHFAPAELSRRQRLALTLVGFGLLALLAVAAWLRPSPWGRGTHQQLGLPPCTFLFMFDKPCPSCGMTTAWAHFVRGQWRAALTANVGGALLAALALAVSPCALVSAARGRPLVRLPSDRVLIAAAALVVLVTLGDWMRKLGAIW